MSTNTTNFNWILPTVGGDANIWGGADLGLNSNLNSQDALIRRLMNTFIDSTAPAERQSGTMWIDNTTNPWVWSVYNSGTTTWVEIGSIDPVGNTFTPSSGGSNEFFEGDLKNSTQPSDHGQWLLCDGRALSRATYSGLDALYSAQTYPFGDGDGSTTFNIPDMRGATAGGIGLSGLAASGTNTPWSQTTTWVAGDYRGEEVHTLLTAEMPSHAHPVAAATVSGPIGEAFNSSAISSATNHYYSIAPSAANQIMQNTGGGGSHNIMQPTVYAGSWFVFTGVS